MKFYRIINNQTNREVNSNKNKKRISHGFLATDQNKIFIKEYNKIHYDNLKYISMITFGGNCIIIKKMTEKEYQIYGNRKYRFLNKL